MEQNLSNKKPLVSIITPTLNSEKFLEKTIKSIVNQDYGNIEHIIVDGGSSDNTIEILKEYEKKYNLRWISKKDRGVAEAYDRGLKMAKGEIVGWCNSDDFYTEGAIKKIAKAFIENPDADLVFGACQEFNYKTQQFSTIYKKNPSDFLNVTFEDISCGKKQLFQPSLFYSRRIIKKTGPLNTNYKFSAIEVDWWIRMLRNEARVIYLDEILVIIGQHEQRISIRYVTEGIKENIDFLKSQGREIPIGMKISYLRWKHPQAPNFIKKHCPFLFVIINKIIKIYENK